ncbi:N-terminal Xaa-Pro-Lys N-methyltransferase 1 [Hylaeus anthracinus]|uniref:N-terminal Xaa-Pro-Lys N-methyltransferase 1-like n=1 Tax=Hylaeus volcanicus TaxID=313075 RepID=UPI0023B87635|nr:N-terminal Xaa-Pro-Lys N-methyltransferase 1-like [Hylaeus volcanicus]XP_053984011.1 N-terminal Xaa-Pro-Lys N-methyltransferase 1-like [Hylaeus volcanicus]XP_054009504.1 N-terminal Xaa-Pro-Lys N-methyltransferase 1 [Hylaeus anthracinus]XP_054009505.1 N-terminal Xaa-Pro-Lys N-methyltransferase 1 [Hylaeus anthracinus]
MEQEENIQEQNEFYTAAANYWDDIPPTVDGMLGGFGFISQTDIKGSTVFLKALFESKNPPSKTSALDCGSGIGRITKNLLLNYFKHVDLVEQNSKFLEAAKTNLKNYSSRVDYYPIGLQNFHFTTKKYDVIWCQWVLGHLKEDDLIEFLKKCLSGLRPNGLIIIKENVTSSKNLEVDTKDSSVTRPLSEFYHIFQKSNLICIKEEQQHKFPRGLYPVYMFALKSVDNL